MQDARDPHAAIRTAVQDALAENGCAAIAPEIMAAVMQRLLATDMLWVFAALAQPSRLRTATISRSGQLTPRPRMARWFECPSCLFSGVAEYSRCCENCGAKIEWTE